MSSESNIIFLFWIKVISSSNLLFPVTTKPELEMYPLALILPEAVMWLSTVKSPSFIVKLEGLIVYAAVLTICIPFKASTIIPSVLSGPFNFFPKIVLLALILLPNIFPLALIILPDILPVTCKEPVIVESPLLCPVVLKVFAALFVISAAIEALKSVNEPVIVSETFCRYTLEDSSPCHEPEITFEVFSKYKLLDNSPK